MPKLRSEDCAGSAFYSRTDRIYNCDESGLWFFRTREGNNIGPFRYRSEAEEMLGRFIVTLQEAARENEASEKLRFRTRSSPRVALQGGYTVS
jgi:hypothetical protein